MARTAETLWVYEIIFNDALFWSAEQYKGKLARDGSLTPDGQKKKSGPGAQKEGEKGGFSGFKD